MHITLSQRQIDILAAMARSTQLSDLNSELHDSDLSTTDAEEFAGVFKLQPSVVLPRRMVILCRAATTVVGWDDCVREFDKVPKREPLATFEIIALTQLLWS